MDGTIGSSIRLASGSADAGKRLGLRDGEILSIRIGKSLGKGRYTVVVRGSVLTVRSTVPLEAGRIIHTRVVISGERVELRLTQPVGSHRSGGVDPAGPAATSIPPRLANLIVQSMRRSGLPITPESMAAIVSMVPRVRRRNPSVIRFATILFDKHLHLDPDLVEELYLTLAGERREGFDRRRGGQHGGQGADRGARRRENGGTTENVASGAGGQAAEHRRPAPLGERRTLRATLRARLQGSDSEEAGWWALFNHLPGGHEDWVVVPFGLQGETAALDGSIRILLGPAAHRRETAGLAVSRAVVMVDGVGAFDIEGSPPQRVAVHADTTAMRNRLMRLLPELGEKLRNLGVEVDDTINGGKNFDGFSSETGPMRGVDAIV